MTEQKKEKNAARPVLGRAFLSFRKHIKLPDLKAHIIFWLLVVLGTTLDLVSKREIFRWLSEQGLYSVSIIEGFFRIVRVENTGAAFGIAAGKSVTLIVASVVALIAIPGIFLLAGGRDRVFSIAFGLLTAGICGNLYDRIFNDGRVRDFIDVVYWPGKHWPAFNIADSMLCIGVGLLFIAAVFTQRPSQEHAQQHK